MTLRLRLVLGLGALVLAGLTLFGVTTYTLYARSQYQRLDEQLQGYVPLVTRQLFEAAGLAAGGFDNNGFRPGGGGPPGGGGGGGGGAGGPGPVAPVGTYAELRDRAGALISQVHTASDSSGPNLPGSLAAADGDSGYFTTGDWRVFVTNPRGGNDDTIVIAVPMTEVNSALNRLIILESSGGAILLAVLSIGAWLILRRGLRPLEHMAVTTKSIGAGNYSQRVDIDGPKTEVGQLGTAFNTMLDKIEAAFAERDATELRLRQFLADASHELRTPLTSIQGFAELFRLGTAHSEHVDLDTILRRIEQESARMRVLVEDLLLLARLDETRPVDRKPVDLTVLAADACSDAVAAAPDRAVTLDAPEPVVVLGDQAHLRQAIGNLVANAIRHTPPGTPIDVAARLDKGSATVAVRDHGPGLDDEAQAHVFDRFWQADKARAGAGAGLGLSIVAGIATEHGGRAEAANVADGGAVFTLRLPLNGSLASDTGSH